MENINTLPSVTAFGVWVISLITRAYCQQDIS